MDLPRQAVCGLSKSSSASDPRVLVAVMSPAGYPGLPAWPHSFYSLNLL